MKISEKELQTRKDRIILVAFHLFCQKGIEQVTLAEIAHQAKVGEASVYRYFLNKPHLVFSTLSVLWRAIGGKLEQKTEENQDYAELSGYEQIAAWLECCRCIYLENADYVLFSYESKLYLQRNGIQISAEEYDQLMMEIKSTCTAALDKGKQDGSILMRRDSEDLFYAMWGSLRGYIVKIVIYRALCRDKSPWESRYGIVKEGILNALRTEYRPPESEDARPNE